MTPTPRSTPRRVVGLDLGERRIGVAISDSAGAVATPYTVIERSGDASADLTTLAALVEEVGASQVVVGLPLSLDGSLGPAARTALEEVDTLSAMLEIPVDTHDERLTTVSAERSLRTSRVRGRRSGRGAVDQVAASILLQSWLDTHGSVER